MQELEKQKVIKKEQEIAEEAQEEEPENFNPLAEQV